MFKFLKQYNFSYQEILLGYIVLIAFFLRAFNLGYNAAFGDEAIYVVIGRLGVFGGDWVSYNAASWLSGSQFLYPSLSAVAYSLNGIWASRMLSVVAGTILTLITYFLTLEFVRKDKHQITAGLTGAAIVATATTSLTVSRMATMDIFSLVFFFSGVYFFQKALNQRKVNGQKFFLSAFFVLLASLTKLSTVLYLPLLIGYGLFATTGKGRKLFLSYFFLPVFLSICLYLLFSTSSLIDYVLLQIGREKTALAGTLAEMWRSWKYLLPLSLVGIVASIFRLPKKQWLFLTLGSIWMIGLHLITQRFATVDKNLEFSVVFLAIFAGIGASSVLGLYQKVHLRAFGITLLTALLITFTIQSYLALPYYNALWTDARNANTFLSEHVGVNDKVLTETGPSTIMSVYPKNDITNVSTFDYLKYGVFEGKVAYEKAVSDGYFTYIELEDASLPKSTATKEMHDVVVANMHKNYELVYNDAKITVYRRAF